MAKATAPHFDAELFTFLKDLAAHNDKTWFNANKERYETVLKDPALRFIADFETPLERLSPSFLAIPKASGGSMFRIHRDTRFSNDKTPYKTHVGIQFRHFDAKNNPHAPGWYLHIEPDNNFLGVGMWHPDNATLGRLRETIANHPDDWKRAKRGIDIQGDSLVRAPKGFDPDHPLIEDLKRKDFIATTPLSNSDITAPDFIKRYEKECRRYRSFMRFLTEGIGLPY